LGGDEKTAASEGNREIDRDGFRFS